MNNSVDEVDVGTPPSGFKKWESALVHFHGFAELSTIWGVEINSPKFVCLGQQWRLSLYPGGSEDYAIYNGMVTVYLNNMSNERIEIIFSLSVRNSSGKEIACLKDKNDFCPCIPTDGSDRWGDDLAEHSTLLDALVDGTLTIEVRMKKIGQESCSAGAFIPENPLRQNILKLFMDKESADVIFEVGGEQGKGTHKKAKTSSVNFHAHRVILHKGAPALADIIGSDSGGGMISVPITNVDPNIFRSVLNYVYGGKVSEDVLKENAKDFIDAADKFGVVGLKLEAEACIVKSTEFTTDNVLENLLYADSMNCALMKEAVMDFLVENGDAILGKVSFDNVPGSALTDLLTAVTRGKKKDAGSIDASNDLNTMRVDTLRRMLHEKGLDVDGSREAMIALLKEKS